MLNYSNAIVIASVWIACGIYAHSKRDSEIFLAAIILTALMW